MNRLEGKVALVTAAGQGIGRAIAEKFAAEGAKLIATDLDPNKLQGLRGKLRKLDVLAPDDIEAFSRDIGREYGALDVLVNCAGYVHQGSVLDCSDKDWDFSFNLNVKSMHHMIKTFLPGMLQKKAGSIVNISSTVSSIRGVPNRYAYGATKAAVIGAHQSRRRRFHQARNSLQRRLPGDDRIAVARRAHQCGIARQRPLARSGPPGLCRAPADGAARDARRSRLADTVLGKR
jgi:2-keto-3-deoxy-L-fuconate dehydrogenase